MKSKSSAEKEKSCIQLHDNAFSSHCKIFERELFIIQFIRNVQQNTWLCMILTGQEGDKKKCNQLSDSCSRHMRKKNLTMRRSGGKLLAQVFK